MILFGLYAIALASCVGLIGALSLSAYQNHMAQKQLHTMIKNATRFQLSNNSFVRFTFHKSAGF